MKYLKKRPDSEVLAQDLVYRTANPKVNARIRELLVEEQEGYCAYTERKIDGLDSVDVEHFDPYEKGADDYYNYYYYAVIHAANKAKTKKERKQRFEDAAFFGSRFFQLPGGFEERVAYIGEDHVYEERSLEDQDAALLIDYLSINGEALVTARKRQVERLRDLFGDDTEGLIAFLKRYPEQASFPTAIEAAFGISL